MVVCEQRFFYPQSHCATDGAHGNPKSQEIGWGDIIELLVANGHHFAELGNYTARQLLLFYEKALIRRRRERADRTVDVSFGVNGGKEVQGYIDELTAP